MKTQHFSYTRFLHDAEKLPKNINLANSEQRTANSEQRTANSEQRNHIAFGSLEVGYFYF